MSVAAPSPPPAASLRSIPTRDRLRDGMRMDRREFHRRYERICETRPDVPRRTDRRRRPRHRPDEQKPPARPLDPPHSSVAPRVRETIPGRDRPSRHVNRPRRTLPSRSRTPSCGIGRRTRRTTGRPSPARRDWWWRCPTAPAAPTSARNGATTRGKGVPEYLVVDLRRRQVRWFVRDEDDLYVDLCPGRRRAPEKPHVPRLVAGRGGPVRRRPRRPRSGRRARRGGPGRRGVNASFPLREPAAAALDQQEPPAGRARPRTAPSPRPASGRSPSTPSPPARRRGRTTAAARRRSCSRRRRRSTSSAGRPGRRAGAVTVTAAPDGPSRSSDVPTSRSETVVPAGRRVLQ